MIRSRSLALAAVVATAGLTLLTGCQDGPKTGAAGSPPAGPSTEAVSPGTDGSTSPAPASPAAGPVKSAYPPANQTPAPGAPGGVPGTGATPGAPGGAPGGGAAPGGGGVPGAYGAPGGGGAAGAGGVPVKRFATPNEAATYLVDAWRRGDRQAALRAAGPNTVNKVLAVHYVVTPIDECTPQTGSGHAFLCYHRYEGGSTGFDVDPYAPSGYRVVNFTRTAD